MPIHPGQEFPDSSGTNEFIGQNSYDRRAEKALSELDTPQSLVISFLYELPVGQGKKFMDHGGVTNAALGGWYTSGILTYQSGQPTEVYANCGGTAGDVLFAGCHFTGAARVNVAPGVSETNKSNFNPFTTSFWNASAFSDPAPFTFGNEPRSLSSARFFGTKNEDISLGKKTHLWGEHATLDIRGEFFNIFNRHTYIPSVGGPNLDSPFQCGRNRWLHWSLCMRLRFDFELHRAENHPVRLHHYLLAAQTANRPVRSPSGLACYITRDLINDSL